MDPCPTIKKKSIYYQFIKVLLRYLGNVQDDWPKLFQAFSVKFTLIFFSRVFNQSLHISTCKSYAYWPYLTGQFRGALSNRGAQFVFDWYFT